MPVAIHDIRCVAASAIRHADVFAAFRYAFEAMSRHDAAMLPAMFR